MDASHLDRQAVEKLFGVGERRARQLMTGLLGIRASNAVTVSRAAPDREAGGEHCHPLDETHWVSCLRA